MTILEDPSSAAAVVAPTRPDEARIARRERLRLLLRSPTFVLGCLLFGVWVVCAVFGTLIAPYDPQADDILNKLAPPSDEHIFGSDRLVHSFPTRRSSDLDRKSVV